MKICLPCSFVTLSHDYFQKVKAYFHVCDNNNIVLVLDGLNYGICLVLLIRSHSIWSFYGAFEP